MKKSRLSIFYKYVISFFIVALLPIGIGVASFYQYNIRALKEQTGKINRQKLKQTAELLDEVVYNHFRMASAVTAEGALQSSQLLGSSYDQYESLSIIKPYLNRNQDLEKGFLIMKQRDVVYSATGIMSFSTMSEMVLGLKTEDEEDLEEIIRENTDYMVWEQEGDYVMFLHPVPVFRPYGNLLFCMNKDAVRKMFGDSLGGEQNELFLMWEEQVVLSDLLEEETKALGEQLEQLGNEASGSLILDSAGSGKRNHKEILFQRSDRTGMVYGVAFSGESSMIKELEQQKDWMVLIGFFMLFLCTGLAFLVAAYTYKPIRELLRMMDKPLNRKNELQALHDYIEGQKELKDSVHWQTPYVQQRIMELYLEGMIDEKEQYKAFGNFRFLSGENVYFTLVIHVQGRQVLNVSQYRQEILNWSLEMELKMDVHVCHMERLKDSAIVWIVNVKKGTAEEAVLMVQKKLKDILVGERGLQLVVGVGNCVECLTEIRSSFYEALAAAEYLQEHSGGTLLWYRDLSEVLLKEEMPDGDTVLKLVQSLRKGDKVLSKELFLQYYDNLQQHYKSQILLKYFIFQSIKTLMAALENYVPEGLKQELAYLAGMELGGQQREQVILFVDKVCTYRAASQKSNQQELTQRILDYIRENAFLPTLSLEQMGDEFGLSTYYISRFMTEQTGDNLKNYITRLRIGEAKRLLTATNLPLYEIVTQVGYLDVSSFIRKFKKEAGMTPGEYRDRFTSGE